MPPQLLGSHHRQGPLFPSFLPLAPLPTPWRAQVYLTDCNATTPAFAVAPKTNNPARYPQLSDAKEQLASSYCEVPIFAKAGTCLMYDTELFHCRWDGETTAHRRTMQEYFYREDRPSGTLNLTLDPLDPPVQPNSRLRSLHSLMVRGFVQT